MMRLVYPPNWTQGTVSRMITFIIAIALSLVLLVSPQLIAREAHEISHGILSLWLLCLCMMFVHGVGFKLHSAFAQWIFSPFLLWPACLLLSLDSLA